MASPNYWKNKKREKLELVGVVIAGVLIGCSMFIIFG